jgi:hypothetical protein
MSLSKQQPIMSKQLSSSDRSDQDPRTGAQAGGVPRERNRSTAGQVRTASTLAPFCDICVKPDLIRLASSCACLCPTSKSPWP